MSTRCLSFSGRAASLISAGAALVMAAAATSAQPPATPLDKAVESRADAPATIAPAIHDPDIESIVSSLTGSFAAAASGDRPALRLNATAISVTGLSNAVYFEITREDSPAVAFRQGVFHLYRFKSELRLRIFDIAGNPGLKDTLVGMWAAPEVLPTLALSTLDPNLDLVMSKSGTGWSGATPHAYPVARDGAVEMTAKMAVGAGELRMSDTGVGADGTPAWGGGASEAVFVRSSAPSARVDRKDGGLTIITLAAAETGAPALIENGEVAVQYTGWLTDGARFDSSRQPGREAFALRVPGGVIKGWNDGLMGIAKGERRRLIIPPSMAYGERGTRDGRIPPNSTLVFDVECVYVNNTQPETPAPMVSPHGMPRTPPPAPAPGSSGEPKPTEPTPK